MEILQRDGWPNRLSSVANDKGTSNRANIMSTILPIITPDTVAKTSNSDLAGNKVKMLAYFIPGDNDNELTTNGGLNIIKSSYLDLNPQENTDGTLYYSFVSTESCSAFRFIGNDNIGDKMDHIQNLNGYGGYCENEAKKGEQLLITPIDVNFISRLKQNGVNEKLRMPSYYREITDDYSIGVMDNITDIGWNN